MISRRETTPDGVPLSCPRATDGNEKVCARGLEVGLHRIAWLPNANRGEFSTPVRPGPVLSRLVHSRYRMSRYAWLLRMASLLLLLPGSVAQPIDPAHAAKIEIYHVNPSTCERGTFAKLS